MKVEAAAEVKGAEGWTEAAVPDSERQVSTKAALSGVLGGWSGATFVSTSLKIADFSGMSRGKFHMPDTPCKPGTRLGPATGGIDQIYRRLTRRRERCRFGGPAAVPGAGMEPGEDRRQLRQVDAVDLGDQVVDLVGIGRQVVVLALAGRVFDILAALRAQAAEGHRREGPQVLLVAGIRRLETRRTLLREGALLDERRL